MFNLQDDYVLLDNKEVAVLQETNSNKFYFAERIAVRGELKFGVVPKNGEVRISLADNNINTPIIIDSIVAFSDESTSDEIVFNLYRSVDGVETLIGTQRYSNTEMPIDFPDGVIYPDMVVGVSPKVDSTIVVYCKPVKVIFQAEPSSGSLVG